MYENQIKVKHELRTLNCAMPMLSNCIKLRKYDKAAEISRRMAGIFTAWQKTEDKGKEIKK